jgi:DNA-binding NtrC family response regulator
MPFKAIVLVVEDEPLLLLEACDVVRDAGFEPVRASNADEAIRILENRSDICILFTDVDMPGSMDGVKLAAAVRGRWPPIELLVVSGYRKVELSELPEHSRFFPKPYDSQEVVDALIEMAA